MDGLIFVAKGDFCRAREFRISQHYFVRRHDNKLHYSKLICGVVQNTFAC